MKFKHILPLLALLLFIAACKNTNSPQSVTERFLTAIAQLDFKTAKNLSTKQTWGILDILQAQTKDFPEDEKENLENGFKVKITSFKKVNDSTSNVGFETTPPMFSFNIMPLKKYVDQEGKEKWKVDISTLDLMGNDSIQQIMVPGYDEEGDSVHNNTDSAAD